MEELATKYDPRAVEDKWYAYWMQHRLFHSEPDAREPYTIVIPRQTSPESSTWATCSTTPSRTSSSVAPDSWAKTPSGYPELTMQPSPLKPKS